MEKRIWVLCAVVWMTVGFAGCGEHVKNDRAEKVQTSEMKTDQEGEQVPEDKSGQVEEPTAEAAVGEEEESVPEEQAQEEFRVEPTDEHDRQMLALLDEACGSKIYTYVSVDMDKDGENEMIGVANERFSVWYCSSDLKDCYMVSEGPSHWYDDCTIEQIEFDEERHIVVNTYNMLGNDKSYSILALHDGGIEILVNDIYGYVYMNEKNDIILDVEAYDGEYEKTLDIWTTHTWKDTYLYYENGSYKEYSAATLSEKEFLKYDNAQELLDEIEKENRNENVLEIHYSYYFRENGIVLIQCEEEQEEFIAYYHYTFHENENHLDVEMSKNYGHVLVSYHGLMK